MLDSFDVPAQIQEEIGCLCSACICIFYSTRLTWSARLNQSLQYECVWWSGQDIQVTCARHAISHLRPLTRRYEFRLFHMRLFCLRPSSALLV